jgi:hypothetical protein
MSVALYCFLLAASVAVFGLRETMVMMVALAIFLIFDITFGGDPRQRQ